MEWKWNGVGRRIKFTSFDSFAVRFDAAALSDLINSVWEVGLGLDYVMLYSSTAAEPF